MSVACLYSIITTLASISVMLKPAFTTGFLLFSVIWDVVKTTHPLPQLFLPRPPDLLCLGISVVSANYSSGLNRPGRIAGKKAGYLPHWAHFQNFVILVVLQTFIQEVFISPDNVLRCVVHQVMLGLVASATGTAGGVAYIGLKGNSHTGWMKVCNVYDKFCRHLAGSIAVALFASFVLVFLIILSVFSLHRKIPK